MASFLKKRGLQAERAPPAVLSQGTEPPLPGGLGRGGGLRETRVLQRETCTNAFRDFVFDVETFRNVPCRLTYRIFQGRMSLWVVFASVLPWRGDAAGQQAGSGEAHVWPTRPLLPSPRSPALGRSRPPRAAPSTWDPRCSPRAGAEGRAGLSRARLPAGSWAPGRVSFHNSAPKTNRSPLSEWPRRRSCSKPTDLQPSSREGRAALASTGRPEVTSRHADARTRSGSSSRKARTRPFL